MRAAAVLLAALVASTAAAQSRITADEAAAVLTAASSSLPNDFRGRSATEIAQRWPSWVEQRDREVRARLARGDEDSLVNFWLYGTSFTAQPPAVARDSTLPSASFDRLVTARLEDLLDRVATPGGNERLQFARRMLTARNAEPTGDAGRERARRFFRETRQRMIREFAGTEQTLTAARSEGTGAMTAANATLFRDRGLSSDTSILADYSVHVALDIIARQKTLGAGSVRRIAIIGPGLDFTNKADGYDFYPQQTMQPFALIDSLRVLGLAAPDLQVTTFDINTRVIEHVKQASSRAASSTGYVVTLPLDANETWTDAVLAYWQRWGATIGDEVAAGSPTGAAPVKTRAVRLQPAVVAAVAPRDLNIVVDRLRLGNDERFDLVVATNVLVYYDVFQQALAAANVAAMLRPGGVFVTNTAVLPTSPLKPNAVYQRVSHTPQRYDDLFVYQRED